MTYTIYRSGFGQRYAMGAASPELAWAGQTLGHHQWGVAALLLALFPDTHRDTIVEALFHDSGEPGAADVPYDSKARFPNLAEAAGAAELLSRRAIGAPDTNLTGMERERLDLCDRLEAYLFAGIRAPHLLERADWKVMRSEMIGSAARLGVEDKVREMVG